MQGFNFERYSQEMSNMGSKAHIEIKNAMSVGDATVCRILCVAGAHATPELFDQTLREDFKVMPIQGSFVALSANDSVVTLDGLVVRQDERIYLTDANRHRFERVAVASNMYMDKEEKLWSLSATPAGDILVRSLVEDEHEVIRNLMAVAHTKGHENYMRDMVQHTSEVRACVKNDDFVSFANPLTKHLSFGFATNVADNPSVVVVTDVDGGSHVIDREAIVNVLAADTIPPDVYQDTLIATAASVDMPMIADYYKRVFQRNKAYFEKFMSRFRSHAFC